MTEDSIQCRTQARAAAVLRESGEDQREAHYAEAFRKCMREKGYSARRQ